MLNNKFTCFSLLSVALFLSGCDNDNLDGPRKYFDTHKVGSSPDYGVMKWENDHVISVHGFMNDLNTCEEIVKALNSNACKEIIDGSPCLDPYSCKPLNH